MVCVGERHRVLKSSSASSSVSMALGPERTKPLHNFDLPCLKWGSQRYLRCLRVVSNGGAGGGGGSHRRSEVPRFENSVIDRRRESSESVKRKIRVPKPGNYDGRYDAEFTAMREKLLLDFETKARKMKNEMFGEEEAEAETEAEAQAEGGKQSGAVGLESVPWNLRKRRAAACKAAVEAEAEAPAAGKSSRIEERKTTTTSTNQSPPRSEANNGVKLTRLVRGLPEVKKERTKFSVGLTKKEIENDFMELLGHRPLRRPKKRPRIVQKQLDTLFPGLFLNEITTDTYKVPDVPETGKR